MSLRERSERREYPRVYTRYENIENMAKLVKGEETSSAEVRAAVVGPTGPLPRCGHAGARSGAGLLRLARGALGLHGAARRAQRLGRRTRAEDHRQLCVPAERREDEFRAASGSKRRARSYIRAQW